jgi:hypothetical protein
MNHEAERLVKEQMLAMLELGVQSSGLLASSKEEQMSYRTYRTVLAIVLALGLLGCASQYAPERVADPYGFLSGVLHGALFPIALLGKLVSWLFSLFGVSVFDSVTIIGRPNTGFFYYFGFVLGLGAFSGGSSQAGRM